MSILKVARMGHPILRKVARELTEEEIHSPETARLIEDMIETMAEYSGIGLAAPQVHESIQLAVIEFEKDNARYENVIDQPLLVLINPKIHVLDATEQGYWEGCLSVPELRGYVERPRKIQVNYLDQDGKKQELIAEGFLATVFQHELDHLGGKLFIDRLRDTSRLAFISEYQRYWLPLSEPELGD